ncbi:MAG TPA: ATP-binding protein [Polyangiaceae bacterium]|nr:ATP-binding protein [Polyangiaceae bacterium]
MTTIEVRAEQIRTLYRHGPAVLTANLLNSWIVGAVFWGVAPNRFLLGWCGAMAGITLVRFALHRRYLRAQPAPSAAAPWGRRFVAGSACAGVLWGAAGFFLFGRGDALLQLLLPFVIGGMSAAAAGTVSAHFPSFLAYVVPALLGFVARALLLGDPLHEAMAAMLAVFAIALSFVAKVNHNSLSEAFRLRFQNEALLAELSQAQSRLEETNRTLEQRVSERSEAFRRQSETLRDAQRMEAVGRLAGGVAHDFNNLLMVVLGNASELLKNREPAEGIAGPLSEIRDAASRGAELVKQLLFFGRRHGGRLETVDLNRTLTGLHKLLARLSGEQLTLKVAPSEQPLFVRVDPTQIEQVLINLVSNARDATPNGGTITVATAARELAQSEFGLPPGAYALLTVSDTGAGMSEETRQRVFEPFFTTKEVGKGSGLGLATVYGIVDQSGGKIRVDSAPDRGSEFQVYLPRVAAPESALRAATPKAPPGSVPSVTILLVEDEASVRTVTERMLKKAGHRVFVAQNGEHALTLKGEIGALDLLITDVVMPGLSGPDLALRLQAELPALRTLFISGYSRDHVIPETDAAQGIAFLAKPFTYEALLESVTALLVDYPAPPRKSQRVQLAAPEKLR